ncbi:hypothetical protein MPSEU_000964500 [Mayamaea pseudoterrestris]|nr:hypothetical protein MPSEU_000964500 [Mayamaea pseudoterrestris]
MNNDPSQGQLSIFKKKDVPSANRSPPANTDISHHQEGCKTIYETILSQPPLTSDLYSPQMAMHRPVPTHDDSPYSLETITRRSLPYPLPWQPSASPRELPPDFSWISNSCALRALVGTMGGAGMGLLMGVFMGAMSDATPPVTVIAGKDVPQAPFREQMRVVLRATGEKSLYWCKNFAFLTGIFGGSECLVEKYRGKSDMWNSVYSGCITGAALQAKSGPQAAAFGCGGFAVFSLIADKVMGTH